MSYHVKHRRYGLADRERVLSLYKTGKTLEDVSTELNIPKPTVYRWCSVASIARSVSEAKTGVLLSDEHKRKISESCKIVAKKGRNNPSFKDIKKGYDKLTNELAYIVGVLMGDGYITKAGIGLQVIDKDFIDEFNRCINIQFGRLGQIYNQKGRILKDPRNGKEYQTRNTFILRFNSVVIREMFEKMDYLEFVKHLTIDMKIHWLRGIWDSEGSVNKTGQQILFYNKKREIIDEYNLAIKEILCIDCHVKNSGDKILCAYFGTRDSVINFFETVVPTIQRKWQLYNGLVDRIYNKKRKGKTRNSGRFEKALRESLRENAEILRELAKY